MEANDDLQFRKAEAPIGEQVIVSSSRHIMRKFHERKLSSTCRQDTIYIF